MLRKTHWPVVTALLTESKLQKVGEVSLASGGPPHPTPADISQLHYAEEDSLGQAKTGEDSSICHADRTVLVISKRQEEEEDEEEEEEEGSCCPSVFSSNA